MMSRGKVLAIGMLGIVAGQAEARTDRSPSGRVETAITAVIYIPSLHKLGLECRRSSSGACRFEIDTHGQVRTVDLPHGGETTLLRVDPAATYRVGTAPLTGPWLPLPNVD